MSDNTDNEPSQEPEILGYFGKFEISEGIQVPLNDTDCWNLYPRLREWHDKTKVADYSNLAWGYAGTLPESYPVILRPIVNLHGMAMETHLIKNEKELKENYRPGSAWFENIDGPHYNFDVIMESGSAKHFLTAEGFPCEHFRFKYWHVNLQNNNDFDLKFLNHRRAILKFIEDNKLADFTGILNFKMIGATIIDVSFRLKKQFASLYEDKLIKAIISLYEEGVWKKPAFQSFSAPEGYSIPLWVDSYKKFEVDNEKLEEIKKHRSGLIELHIDYDPTKKKYEYSNPLKSFRIGYINTRDLTAGFEIAKDIKECFV